MELVCLKINGFIIIIPTYVAPDSFFSYFLEQLYSTKLAFASLNIEFS